MTYSEVVKLYNIVLTAYMTVKLVGSLEDNAFLATTLNSNIYGQHDPALNKSVQIVPTLPHNIDCE